jgi:hypothetical protein
MIVHTTSWHYKLLRAFDVNTCELTDSCKYIRKVMLVMVFSAVLAAVALLSVGDFIAWLLVGIFSGWTAPNFGATLVIAVLSIGLILVAAATSHHYYTEWKALQPVKPETPPSFAKQAYRQWRDKFCSRVDIVR